MKRSTVIWVCLLAFASVEFLGLLRSADVPTVDAFLKSSDGEVIGILALGKDKLNITGTIKEVSWTANNGKVATLKWDGDAFVIGPGAMTSAVNSLVSSGQFCQVRGHQWQFGCGVAGCLVNHSGSGPIRHCVVCGITQAQKQGPWE